MYRKPLPTQARIAQLYTPQTLEKAGYESYEGAGYHRVSIDGEMYMRHRLMWILVHGSIPDDKPNVDHINDVKGDDRIDNLQCLSDSENRAKRGVISTNTTGYKGVTRRRGGYQARLYHSNKAHHIGDYPTAIEAHEAWCDASLEHWGPNVHRPFRYQPHHRFTL